METLRVNIAYRPLRICWAIKSGDKDSFRKAVRWSHVLWGGRFNPIVVVDREWEVKLLLEAFRVDIIISIGDSDEIKEFSSKFPYLIKPFHGGIFVGEGRNDVRCQVLDLENALTYLKDMPTWKEVKDRGIRRYTWDASDPLADLFLVQLGKVCTKRCSAG